MEFIGANSGLSMVFSSAGAIGQSAGFGVQGFGATNSSGITDLLRQLKQFMVATKKKRI